MVRIRLAGKREEGRGKREEGRAAATALAQRYKGSE